MFFSFLRYWDKTVNSKRFDVSYRRLYNPAATAVKPPRYLPAVAPLMPSPRRLSRGPAQPGLSSAGQEPLAPSH